jgi:hypothetical protein
MTETTATASAPPPGYVRVTTKRGTLDVQVKENCKTCLGRGTITIIVAGQRSTDHCPCVYRRVERLRQAAIPAPTDAEAPIETVAPTERDGRQETIAAVDEQLAAIERAKAEALAPIDEKIEAARAWEALKATEADEVRSAIADRQSKMRASADLAATFRSKATDADLAAQRHADDANVLASKLPAVAATAGAAMDAHARLVNDHARVSAHWERRAEKKRRQLERLRRRAGGNQ